MTKIELANTGYPCRQCSHHQAEKSMAVGSGVDIGHVSLTVLGAGECTNSESDHFGHVLMNYHQACEEANIP